MIRSPVGLRLEAEPGRSLRDQLIEAARWGVNGVILDAAGDLAPHRLGATGRRDLRNTLQTVQLALIGLHLPTRRPFDTEEDLDDRLNRAEKAFSLAYELGSRLVLARLGAIPVSSPSETEDSTGPRATFELAARELAMRADRQGVRLGVELHDDSADDLRALLEAIPIPTLGASVDPVPIQAGGRDPATAFLTLAAHLVHVYAPRMGARSKRAERLGSARNTSRAAPALDWEAFLGSLEEVDYRGFLTVWPDQAADASVEVQALAKCITRF
jgi:sugar phosphate isomerase/epimerase